LTLTMEDLRRQGQQGLLGAQMSVVVVDKRNSAGKGTFRHYRVPTETECKAADIEIEHLQHLLDSIPHGLPKEPMPPVGTLGMRVPLYGFRQWSDMFSPRQLLALGTFAAQTRVAGELLRGDSSGIAEPVVAYLGCVLNRLADRSSVISQWTLDWDKIRNTFARFALPMCWDFAECVTITEASGGYPGQLELVAQYLDFTLKSKVDGAPVDIVRRSATKLANDAETLDAVVTDPPYYDSIPYSDLMDFFYIWLRRVLWGVTDQIEAVFATPLSPKWNHEEGDGELIDDSSRFGGNKA